MKCLMALNQREAIAAALPESGLMLEWGGGGSTGWFLANVREGQRLVTVEHHASWAGALASEYGHHAGWTLVRCAAHAEVGQNATHWEECPAGLEDYIYPGDVLRQADVVLVDGVARSACLAAAIATGRPGRVVFVHDVQRSWYEWPMRVYADRIRQRRVIEPTPGDYPAKLMEMRL